ncbi:MAG: metallophosphoesterase [Myxococcales bacterium]|nr:metallophosphoesterase [Myxococcales bacterium]
MTALTWATDIHLNFVDDDAIDALAAEMRAAAGSIYVVSGDISEAPQLQRHLERLVAGLDGPLHFVLGNHDYYRSQIDAVRSAIARLDERHPDLYYLPLHPPLAIADGVVLVGVDGWGDARFGDPAFTRVRLNDFAYIGDLRGHRYPDLRRKLERLGDAEAARLAPKVNAAVVAAEHVVIVTHVPPFREACIHEGAISDDDWLPFFTCRAVGEVIRTAAERHRDHRFTVLCGHTHSPGQVELAHNLEVHTGAACYGQPAIADVIEID